MNCQAELLECGHIDCPIHHRCDCIPRAGCELRYETQPSYLHNNDIDNE
jgi:hypothetical protein